MKTSLRRILPILAALSGGVTLAQNPPPPVTPPEGGRPQGTAPDFERPNQDGGARAERRPPGDRAGGPGIRRGSEDAPEGDRVERPMLRDRFPNGNVPAPNKPQPFLGVVTSAPDPTVSAQLGLAGGLGLVVEDLLPESPAAKGGVQPHDILKQINDQLLFNPSQLASLVQHYGKDAEVSVVVLRKGQEQKLTVKIGERVMPERRGFNGDFFGGAMSRLPRFDNLRRPMGEPNRDSENPPRDPGGRSRGPDEQPREGRPDPRGARGESADILREVGPNGAPEIRRSQDQTSTTWNTASARVMLKDEAGEMEVRSDDGKRVLTAKNAKGEVVFNGPIDTEEQRKGIPEEFRKKLEQIDIHSRAERRPPSQFQPRRGEEAPSPRDPGSSPRPPREREVQ